MSRHASRRQILGALALAALPLPAVAQSGDSPLPVVATFSILGDFVRQVGGNRIALTTLVPAGGDAHVYSPTPADARSLANARLVFVNGLGFEGWVSRLIRSSGTRATVVTATAGIRPLKAEKGGHSHGHSHDHGENDPHAWQSVANAKLYVEAIRSAFIAADPAGARPTRRMRAPISPGSTSWRRRSARPSPAFRPTGAASSPRTTPSSISSAPMASISSRRAA